MIIWWIDHPSPTNKTNNFYYCFPFFLSFFNNYKKCSIFPSFCGVVILSFVFLCSSNEMSIHNNFRLSLWVWVLKKSGSEVNRDREDWIGKDQIQRRIQDFEIMSVLLQNGKFKILIFIDLIFRFLLLKIFKILLVLVNLVALCAVSKSFHFYLIFKFK